MKLLKLTAVSTLLRKEAEDKINKATRSPKVLKDEDGRTAEWYMDLGMRVPEHLENDEHEEDVFIEFDDEDFEDFHNYTVIPLKNFLFCTDKEFSGSILYLEGNLEIEILQSSREVQQQIEYLNRNWIQKLIDKLTK